MAAKRFSLKGLSRTNDLFGTIVVYTVVTILSLTMLLPFVHELAKSFSYPTEVEAGKVGFTPKKFTWGNYYYYWRKQQERLGRAFWNTIVITVIGTVWTVLSTALLAFPLSRSRKEFRFGGMILGMVIFCFVFQRPMIPYFLTVKAYGLLDTRTSIILAHTIVPFYLFLMLNFFRELPEELFDSCRMDGGNELHLFWHVVLPLSKAVLATVAIFSGVIFWNMFFHAKLFIRTADLMPLQPMVRSIMTAGGDTLQGGLLDADPFRETESIKSALIILTTLPIVLAYPFLQKYFTQGARVGSVKG